MAYVAQQLQATGSKNQLVLGSGNAAVLGAEKFGQVSVIKVPDPGKAKGTDFVLTSTATGGQTIQGNLTVVGTIKASGGSSGDELLNGDLVFSNASDRQIRFDAPKISQGAQLSILGNTSTDDNGGDILIRAGTALDNGGQGGAVTVWSGIGGPSGGITGPATFGSAPGTLSSTTTDSADATLSSGDGRATGDVTVITGTASNGESGELHLKTGDASSDTGSVYISTGDSSASDSGSITLFIGHGGAGGNGLINIGVDGYPPASINIGRNDMAGDITINGSVAGGLLLNAGGNQAMTCVTNKTASATMALNGRVGHAVFIDFTTPVGNRQAFTITNTAHTSPTQLIFATVCNTGSADAQMTLTRVNNTTAGTLIFNTINNGTADLVGDVHVNFWIVN